MILVAVLMCDLVHCKLKQNSDFDCTIFSISSSKDITTELLTTEICYNVGGRTSFVKFVWRIISI